MTAIAARNMSGFVRYTVMYVGVFAALTVVAVFYRFAEERLGLLWRESLTRGLVGAYLDHPVYHRLSDRLVANGEIANPDQRITEDVRAFTSSSLSFLLLGLNATLTVFAFSGVLWSISPFLFAVSVGYAAVGSCLAFLLGRPLVSLNYRQADKEAEFRADLLHVREHAESIALGHYEQRLQARLLRRFAEVVDNFKRIIAVNRNLGCSTTGYNYLIQIIPVVLVAPLFIRGDVEFGVIAQATIAFAQLVGAFSLIVTQFQSISSYAAVMARLDSLAGAIEQARAAPVLLTEVCPHHQRTTECPICMADIVPVLAATRVREEADGRVAYEQLTLLGPERGEVLIRNLSVSIPRGTRVLVTGPNEAAKEALFRATAGLWETGEGKVIRPPLEQILFVPEQPYLPPGTLRETLAPIRAEVGPPDDRILPTLRALGLESVLQRAQGLDTEQDWHRLITLSEQQLLACARLVLATPTFAFLERLSNLLSSGQIHRILRALSANAITYVCMGGTTDSRDYYDAVLEVAEDGAWRWEPTDAAPSQSAPT
jgi:putative ATP-binding cassette transporter